MKVLIFGGTAEGRKLSTALSKAGIDITLSVATEFGRNVAELGNHEITVLNDRLEEEDMLSLMKQGAFDCVIDATHPYAVMATRNIRSASLAAGIDCLRLKRPENSTTPGVTYAPDLVAAVEILKKSKKKALLTIGSKGLEPFTYIEHYIEQLYIRILPMQESLEKALALGFRGSNIICMQGPFDREMNVATLKMTGAKCLVTKDSGDAGGYDAKVSAALSLGCEVIVIARPVQEEGYTFEELLDIFKIKEIPPKQATFFPLFVDMSHRKALVIGGGNIAEGRIKKLLSFGADVVVISPKATEHIERAALQGRIPLLKREYQNGDIINFMPFLVIAATDDRQANHAAMKEAARLIIPISVADCREECTCYFPAVAENEAYIAGIISKNGDHIGVKRTAEKIRGLLNS